MCSSFCAVPFTKVFFSAHVPTRASLPSLSVSSLSSPFSFLLLPHLAPVQSLRRTPSSLAAPFDFHISRPVSLLPAGSSSLPALPRARQTGTTPPALSVPLPSPAHATPAPSPPSSPHRPIKRASTTPHHPLALPSPSRQAAPCTPSTSPKPPPIASQARRLKRWLLESRRAKKRYCWLGRGLVRMQALLYVPSPSLYLRVATLT